MAKGKMFIFLISFAHGFCLSTFHTAQGNLLKSTSSSLLSRWLGSWARQQLLEKMPQKWNTKYQCSPRSVSSAFDFLQLAGCGCFSFRFARRCFVLPSVVHLRHSMLDDIVTFNVARFAFFFVCFTFSFVFQRNNSFVSFSLFRFFAQLS